MTAKEILNLKPAEWEEAVDSMSWRELRDVADKMRRAAKRVQDLSGYLDSEVNQRESTHAEIARSL